MGGLIGTAAYDKSGLMPAQLCLLDFNKNNNEKARITLKIQKVGQVFIGTLNIFNVHGEACAIYLNIVRWNYTKVYSNLICGYLFDTLKLSYTDDEGQSISIYIDTNQYMRICLQSFSYEIRAEVSKHDSIPSNATQITFY